MRPGLSPPCVPRSEDVRAGGLTPTVCRLVKDLTGDIEAVHKAISTARRMTAHQRVWVLAASTPLLRASRRRASYSVGFTLPDHMPQIYRTIPQRAWSPAYNTDGQPKDGADVTEITDLLDLAAWPPGMRAIMRRERPHLGAPLRFEDVDGYRLTAFATNTGIGQLPDLEVRHRLRARCSDRIRCATSTELGSIAFPWLCCQPRVVPDHRLGPRHPGLGRHAGPGRNPCPQMGAGNTAPPTDGHPRRHHYSPRPAHYHPLQGLSPLDRDVHKRPHTPAVPTRPIPASPNPHRPIQPPHETQG